jgi:hypothetical protein
VYFRDPLPYIPGLYHKTTTFVIENIVNLLKYLIHIVRQVVGPHLAVPHSTITDKS